MNGPVSWWTPSGFQKGEPPEPYASLFFSTGDWDKLLKDAGYETFIDFGGEFDPLKIHCLIHSSGSHLMIDITGEDAQLSLFFVKGEHREEFFATWYLRFVRDASLAKIEDYLRRIQTTLTAFVRHGQGEDTVDEYGDRTLDDERRWRERQRERQREKESG